MAADAHTALSWRTRALVAGALAGAAPSWRMRALVAGALALGCGVHTEPVLVVVSAPASSGVDLDTARWEPASAVRHASRLGDGRLALELDAAELPGSLVVRAAEACPLRVDLASARGGARIEAAIAPWIDLGGDRPQVGFASSFEIDVRPGCREAIAGRVVWRQIEGPPLPELADDKNGFHVRGRTHALAAVRPDPLPWGIVPLSPATRGAYVLEATWRGQGAPVVRTVRVSSAARATGIPSVPVGQRVVLGGGAFHVVERPPAAHADVIDEAGVATFLPDAPGRFRLEDETGAALLVRAGRHDQTPLDCGRSECHAPAAEAARSSPMTHVLARALEGDLGAGYDARCAVACHAVGEPGLLDGGFSDVASELGFTLPRRPAKGTWDALPRPLRRLGGVGCTACHGPGAIPEASARAFVLRSDVCAVCHDAPPRYGHVAAWRTSRMARSDALAETRSDARCAQCHSTAGFLAAIGARPALQAKDATPDLGPMGIACAACHAPHAAETDGPLLRRVPLPAGFDDAGDTPSRVCLRCHAPLADDVTPSASAAALWLGRAGSSGSAAALWLGPPGSSGDHVEASSPHRAVPGGCVGCHSGASPQVTAERGGGHAFAADPHRCAPCHASGPPAERPGPAGLRVRERAAALWSRLLASGVVTSRQPGLSGPPHAQRVVLADPSSPAARAAYDVLLVLEDPAAGVHDAPLARALLDAAEAQMGAPPR